MRKELTNVTAIIGIGSIGQAIAHRVSAGKHTLLADLRKENNDRPNTGTVTLLQSDPLNSY